MSVCLHCFCASQLADARALCQSISSIPGLQTRPIQTRRLVHDDADARHRTKAACSMANSRSQIGPHTDLRRGRRRDEGKWLPTPHAGTGTDYILVHSAGLGACGSGRPRRIRAVF